MAVSSVRGAVFTIEERRPCPSPGRECPLTPMDLLLSSPHRLTGQLPSVIWAMAPATLLSAMWTSFLVSKQREKISGETPAVMDGFNKTVTFLWKDWLRSKLPVLERVGCELSNPHGPTIRSAVADYLRQADEAARRKYQCPLPWATQSGHPPSTEVALAVASVMINSDVIRVVDGTMMDIYMRSPVLVNYVCQPLTPLRILNWLHTGGIFLCVQDEQLGVHIPSPTLQHSIFSALMFTLLRMQDGAPPIPPVLWTPASWGPPLELVPRPFRLLVSAPFPQCPSTSVTLTPFPH